MKNRSRNITVWLAFAVSLMALSITGGDLLGQEPPQECVDLKFTGCVDSCTQCGDCDDLCEKADVEGCIADDEWEQCDVDAEFCPDGKIYWECACVEKLL